MQTHLSTPSTKPTTLQALIDYGNKIKREKGDPLDGVNLKGVDIKALNRTEYTIDEGTKNELKDTKGKYEIFREYKPLFTEGRGNCFLNALALYLTGKKGDEQNNFSNNLRAKLCLELMTDEEIMGETTHREGKTEKDLKLE